MNSLPETHRTEWKGIALSIIWVPEWFMTPDGSFSVAHLEVLSDGRVPLPISETGYRSQFPAREFVEAQGGPVAYVLGWLEHDAELPAWKTASEAARQFSLL